ncbi:hypothetical protein SAMN05444000_10393 [Shimia gijangensis]|uniref:Uncharacterized protein n=1 Tax=Shimia gijangensis TaxID=1470563 RepID=A0A1M6E3A9_9RHOB|nr:hypothetical protein [Shimia gijangensis]SHI79931.1 hypothetical protein SAMN05444000_10393 [Shimia gijangensis]
MRFVRKSMVLAAATGLVVMALELGASFDIGGGYASEAEARLGRPATPVSVAGVGRRTVRRCAAGVFNC